MEYLELLIDHSDYNMIKSELKKMPQIEIEDTQKSRDWLVVGVTVLTIGANSVVLINELIRLRDNFRKKEINVNITIRNVNGDELEMNSATKENIENLLKDET